MVVDELANYLSILPIICGPLITGWPLTLLMVLASSTSGDQHFFEMVTLSRPPPHQDWGRAKTAGNRFVRDDKEPGEAISRRTAS
jgi:hypothetical protein